MDVGKTVKKSVVWTAAVVVVLFLILVIARMPVVYRKQKTAEQVAKIHATKLTLDDVLGKNLPPDPGADADKAIAGIDANSNGIRDDVELAIFKEYPNSAKTRAVLLQYALALQMEMTTPLVNRETVIAVAQERSIADICIGDIVSRDNIQNFINITGEYVNFIKKKQINTQ
ncbi:hypothetical protein HY629_01690, partial [Candidatus Uhrbacteria bacterium]|nr:hypothetical protein [Candidatus Uhrbacteria bacterium]